MRIEIYFTLGLLTLFKDVAVVAGKSVIASDPTIEREFENYMNCSRVNGSAECLESTGRKRKGGSGGSNVILVSPGQTSHSTFDHPGTYHYVEVEEFDDEGGKKGKRKGKGKKGKRKKGKKGFLKKMKPLAIGLGGLKMIFDHFLLKKLLFLSLFNFFLSKVSFILATLVALKQFFHNPGGHSRSQESHKVEVIAIPVKKHKKHHESHFFDESKLVPITYPSDLMNNVPETTPPAYFTYPYPSHAGFLSSEEEAFNDLINDNNKEMSAVNDEVDFMKKNNNFERSDTLYNANHDEKSYYLNHVHSPFV